MAHEPPSVRVTKPLSPGIRAVLGLLSVAEDIVAQAAAMSVGSGRPSTVIMGSGDMSGGERGATAARPAGPELPRRSPSTVPGLEPVPEYAADAEMRARYAAMKAGFGWPS